ncbi:hypothetical protein B0H14DRAFT_3076210, partial [Mycena olivaceomarginata]
IPTDLMPKQACPSPQHISQIAPAASDDDDDDDDDEAGLTEDGLGSTLSCPVHSAFCSSFLAAVDPTALEVAIAAHGLVISLVPYTYHTTVMQAAIEGKTHCHDIVHLPCSACP